MNALAFRRICTVGIIAAFVLPASLEGFSGELAAEEATPKKPLQQRPNFVIVLCDDLGYGDLACYGHKVIQTPHVDRFAEESLKLTSCYAAHPNCSPSRTGMMTGRTPMRVGIHSWIPMLSPMHVRKREITVATLLRQAGYATCLSGKWHLNGRFNLPGQPQPSDHGFDHWFATQNNALPSHENPDNFVRNGKPVGKLEGFSAQLVTDEAVAWLTKLRDKEKPFFLFVNYHEPHDPIASAPRFTKRYSDKGQRSRFQPDISSLAAHHGNVTQMDDAFGRLMKTLDEQNLSQNTMVFFTSDNGPAIIKSHPHGSAGPLRGKKGVVYEGGIRVPGMIRWPGHVTPGTVSNVPLSGVDVLPTLCEIVGIDPPKDRAIDGTSFLPLLSNKPIRRTTPLYWHFHQSREVENRPKVAMRIGSWKILATLTGRRIEPYADIRAADQRLIKSAELDTFELYNLDDDIGETTDRAESEPKRLAEMSAKLRQMFREVQKESPTWPAWRSPRIESKRIRDFVASLKKSADR